MASSGDVPLGRDPGEVPEPSGGVILCDLESAAGETGVWVSSTGLLSLQWLYHLSS